MSKDMVFSFLYCDCIYESAYYTVSMHRTAKGAYNAMKKHKMESYKHWEERRREEGKKYHEFKFAEDKRWAIKKEMILE